MSTSSHGWRYWRAIATALRVENADRMERRAQRLSYRSGLVELDIRVEALTDELADLASYPFAVGWKRRYRGAVEEYREIESVLAARDDLRRRLDAQASGGEVVDVRRVLRGATAGDRLLRWLGISHADWPSVRKGR